MMKLSLKYIFILVIGIVFTTSCNNKMNSKDNESFEDEHTAQNSLDWSGYYYGVLPCADCEGIETTLSLTNDQSYVLVSKYLSVKEPHIDTLKGKFTWSGNNIQLDGIKSGERSSMFKIEENQVKYLNMEGNEVEGDISPFYILKKMGNSMVEDKRWKLVELNGQPIEGAAETHYLYLHSDSRQAETKVDCNSISLNYRIVNELVISFEQGMSTLMACPDNLEDEYLKVLSMVDNLSTDGKRLTLNKARMAPLAVFELAE